MFHADQVDISYSEEAERAVLAAVMLNSGRWFGAVSGRIREDDFYFERHQLIWRAMVETVDGGGTPDHLVLLARLEDRGTLALVGGLAYLSTLDEDLPDLSRVEQYAEIIAQRSARRRLSLVATELFRDSSDGSKDLADIASAARVQIDRVLSGATKASAERIGVAVDRALLAIETQGERGGIPGLTTGFRRLDYMIYGLCPGNLIIIAGRPGTGKSSLAVNMSQRLAVAHAKASLVFSLEMSQEELTLRMLASMAEIPFDRLRLGSLSMSDWTRLVNAREMLKEAPIWVDCDGAPTLAVISSRARRARAEGQLDLLVVDHLQLMPTHGENQNAAFGDVTRGLKVLAKDLEIPVVLLSQLSRSNIRENRRPRLSDLRQSGRIEEDADVVLMLHREETNGGADLSPEVDLIVAKNRNGPVGTVPLMFDGPTTRFWYEPLRGDSDGRAVRGDQGAGGGSAANGSGGPRSPIQVGLAYEGEGEPPGPAPPSPS